MPSFAWRTSTTLTPPLPLGTLLGPYDIFLAAQDFREDHSAFIAALSAAQERFGFNRDEIAALLAECVAD